MDPPTNSLSPDKQDTDPSLHTINRHYRRHHSRSGSDLSSDEESPKRSKVLRNSSPVRHRDDRIKASENRQRNDRDYARDTDRETTHTRVFKGNGPEKQSDRLPYVSSHESRRHNDYRRCDRHADEDERRYSRFSYSGRESRRDLEMFKGRRREADADRDFDRQGDGRKKMNSSNEYTNRKERDRHRERSYEDDSRDFSRSPYYSKSDRTSNRQIDNEKEKCKGRDSDEKVDRKKINVQSAKYVSEAGDKKLSNCSSVENDMKWEDKQNACSDITIGRPTSAKDEKASSVKCVTEASISTHQNPGAFNDVNAAATVAAQKAAELVNKNIAGFGAMGSSLHLSTDQKKKLLWGGKKNIAADEASKHWDASLFSDPERQEKFNKLMGVKGGVALPKKVESKDGTDDAKKQEELDTDLEKHYIAGLRRRDGRTVGLGL